MIKTKGRTEIWFCLFYENREKRGPREKRGRFLFLNYLKSQVVHNIIHVVTTVLRGDQMPVRSREKS